MASPNLTKPLRHAEVFPGTSFIWDPMFHIYLYCCDSVFSIKVEHHGGWGNKSNWVRMTDSTNAILSMEDYQRTLAGYRDHYTVREVQE